jgi:hypothetical protein
VVAARTAVLQDRPCTALSTYPLFVALDGVGTGTLPVKVGEAVGALPRGRSSGW